MMHFTDKPMDNCLLLYQLSFQEFFFSFWEGKTLHKLLDRELPMGRKIEMMFPLLLSSPEHYPEELRWHAWGPIYTPEEVYLLQNIIEIRVRLLQQHLDAIPRSLQQDFLTRSYVYFCISMAHVPYQDGNFYPLEYIGEEHFPHSVFMVNFCMSPRSAINFALFGVNLLLEEVGYNQKRLPEPLRCPMVLVALRLNQQTILNRINDDTCNFWNRLYYEYFIHFRIRYNFSMEEQCSMRYFFLEHHHLGRLTMGQWSDFYFQHLRHQGALHPVSGHHRFYYLITSHRLNTSETPDYKVPSYFVLNFPRARM